MMIDCHNSTGGTRAVVRIPWQTVWYQPEAGMIVDAGNQATAKFQLEWEYSDTPFIIQR
jgi:hypothetical protein